MASSPASSDVESGTGILGKRNENKRDSEVLYTPRGRDSKCFRLFTVFLYVSMVSGLGLMLSVYHFFVWDSTMPPVAKVPDKIVIPEQIAIQLINTSEISAEQFYKNIHEYYQKHRNQYLWNKDTTIQNLQSVIANKAPKKDNAVQTEASTSATNHNTIHHPFTKLNEENEAALMESLSTSSREIHSATAPPINEKPSNYDDEDYSEDDSTMGIEASGFFPFNFEYNNRRKFDAD